MTRITENDMISSEDPSDLDVAFVFESKCMTQSAAYTPPDTEPNGGLLETVDRQGSKAAATFELGSEGVGENVEWHDRSGLEGIFLT